MKLSNLIARFVDSKPDAKRAADLKQRAQVGYAEAKRKATKESSHGQQA